MTNTALLEQLIKKSGLKKGYLAELMGISRSYFRKKIDNLVPFNQYEIDVLCKALNIKSLKIKESVFFDENVD